MWSIHSIVLFRGGVSLLMFCLGFCIHVHEQSCLVVFGFQIVHACCYGYSSLIKGRVISFSILWKYLSRTEMMLTLWEDFKLWI